ncbi:hypothetical protein [Flavobacterium sp. 5]|uniref:hypothetical protein n=1 Tax=Flavobacterium sp. 5 TaxID=2035199 RepID=UPI000C2C8607|nr:hypothetical protein [Flavobacterium sp. 5]PKB15953.1 hypothetical protein CLU82_1063 [Flavobacterium sp. 5]
MIDIANKSKQDDLTTENQKETIILNSAVKYREETLEYNKLRNQVDQEYYTKVHGCSVKAKE